MDERIERALSIIAYGNRVSLKKWLLEYFPGGHWWNTNDDSTEEMRMRIAKLVLAECKEESELQSMGTVSRETS